MCGFICLQYVYYNEVPKMTKHHSPDFDQETSLQGYTVGVPQSNCAPGWMRPRVDVFHARIWCPMC